MPIELKNVSFTYEPGLPDAVKAVDDVTLTIRKGEFAAIIGHTGSGKSTLVQFFDGLLTPTEGTVLFDGQDISAKDFSLKMLRGKVGLVFQYPEYQLFEAEVLKDVCYGPKNLGKSKEEQEEAAKRALTLVGIPEEYYDKSPFELSGGEKRRVAIAGILAMDPEYMVLDEPTAGLDPEGRDEILDLCRSLAHDRGIGIVLVSHSMDDVAEYAERTIVLDHGKVVYDDETRKVFMHWEKLEEMGLSAPEILYIVKMLREKGIDIPQDIMSVDEARDELLKVLKK